MTQSIEKQCIALIYGHGRGWAFSQKDLVHIGPRTSIAWALHRLEAKGTIRRAIRGIYDYPRQGSLIKGALGPDIHQVVQAIARRHGWSIEPSGETALNLLGLSTQVPGRYVFFSDGPSRTYTVESTPVEFRGRALKDVRFKHAKSGLLVQALKALGRQRVDDRIIRQLRRSIAPGEGGKIIKDTQYATDWVRAAIAKACSEE